MGARKGSPQKEVLLLEKQTYRGEERARETFFGTKHIESGQKNQEKSGEGHIKGNVGQVLVLLLLYWFKTTDIYSVALEV
jgi:hypothetical protein